VAPNRLATETSPYLLQHADNPVDWYPWGAEAFERARVEGKPIFLSVGYASCHWCHVMERESFEDAATARFLNDHFVCVKVDREERPDVDGIYMDAVQLLNAGQGGWPMSVFLTPDGEPFFAGTYYPKEPRYGTPSFSQVLEAIAQAWRERRAEVSDQARRLRGAIGRPVVGASESEAFAPAVTTLALRTIQASFDERWGGIAGAPKFPQPMTWEFVLRMGERGVPDAMRMLNITLERMADGGIRDQLRGDFSRYSTDERWHVPHFEKMLYDNAQLALLYTRAWLATRDTRWQTTATEIIDALLDGFASPDGGFYSSHDADTDGVEGASFTWTWAELRDVVDADVALALGAREEGNWRHDGDATNVLWRPEPLEDVAARRHRDVDELEREVEDGRRRLAERRTSRRMPAIDDKVLTAWNGLAIRALAEAGRAFDRPTYVSAAERCGSFVWDNLRRDDGRLLRSWRDGRATTPAFADDHALLALGLLTLYETTGTAGWFARAHMLVDRLIELFHDEAGGGFFQTGVDADPLIVRPKDLYDNAVPSANSAAAEATIRMSMHTGDARLERAGVSALRLVVPLIERAPTAFGHALSTIDLLIGPRREVAIVRQRSSDDDTSLTDQVFRRAFLPNVVVARGSEDGDGEPRDALLLGRRSLDGRPTAYVCEGFVCDLPTTDAAELVAQLGLGDP
jgi:uncharacterized protein YyaL (SSP411 family)